MSDNILAILHFESLTNQPSDVQGLLDSERNKLIITATQVDGLWTITSRYSDDIWTLTGFPSNVSTTKRQINFGKVPPRLRAVMKSMFYRYIRRGRNGSARPRGATIRELFDKSLPFMKHLEALKIESMASITPMIAATYIAACKDHRSKTYRKALSVSTLTGRYTAVEAIYELSQYTDDRMPQHPWPDTSARAIAGGTGAGHQGETPLIPDDVFCTLFEKACKQVELGRQLVDLRDELDMITAERKGLRQATTNDIKNQLLKSRDWKGSLKEFTKSLTSLRTACYIVLASTSGCRNHELANLQLGAHHRTEDNEGTTYHWMRSKSEKTDEGIHSWMIPEAAVRALRLMERWSEPYRAMITEEIAQLRRSNPHDPKITEALKHRNSLFLGKYRIGCQVRTLTIVTWRKHLSEFSRECGLSWNLASHQFRRKFANYVAHSRFGLLT